jgi:hypothetical protein
VNSLSEWLDQDPQTWPADVNSVAAALDVLDALVEDEVLNGYDATDVEEVAHYVMDHRE